MSRFKNKVAFITGGARGIGLEYAKALAAEGAAVSLADVDTDAGRAAVAEIEALGGNAVAPACDVGDENSVESAVAQTINSLGGVDILINNAARHLTTYAAPLTEMSRDKWRDMLNVNVIGIINCTSACRSSMAARGGGVVINIASIAGLMMTSPYGISKLAVRGLTVGLAAELAPDNIRVYGICPGAVDSPATIEGGSKNLREDYIHNRQLIKRQGRMTDLLGALKFFCSDEASFITGEMLVIGGGYPLRL